MKSILDIQQDVRKLEILMDQLAGQLTQMNRDLDILREAEHTSLEIDYKQIEQLVQHTPLKGHPLERLKDDYAKKLYLMVLLSLIQIDDEEMSEKKIFVASILKQSQLELSLEELIKYSLSKRDEVFNIAGKIKGDYKYFLIMDMLIILGFAGIGNEQSYTYVTYICAVLGVDKEKVYELSLLARVILEQSADSIAAREVRRLIPYISKYKYYIDKQLTQKVKTATRIIAVKVSTEIDGFKWKVKQGVLVKEGELLATYKNKKNYAPVDGMIYQFREAGIHYGVISVEDDTKDGIKEWIRMRRLNENTNRYTS